MTSRLPILALLAPVILLAGCGGSAERGLESARQPVVSRAEYAIDLSTDGASLSPGELSRLAGWMASLRIGYGDRIFVDDPTGYATGARAEVGGEIARYGLLLSDTAPVTVGTIAPNTVRVIVTRTTARVPGCPNFNGIDQPNFTGKTSSNFGCATNSNLAAMIARPEDLVRGAPGAETIDPATSTKAIETYRKTVPTGAGGLKAEKTGGGGQ